MLLNDQASSDISLDYTLNLTETIVERVGASIVAGDAFDKSKAITVKAVCQYFDVSKTIAREAMKILASKGLLVSQMSRGAVIQPDSQWNLFDKDVLRWIYHSDVSYSFLVELHQLCVAIEPKCAYLMSERAEDLVRRTIDCMASDMERLADQPDKWLAARIKFHRFILSSTGSTMLTRFQDISEIAIRLAHRYQVNTLNEPLKQIRQYQKLSTCICKAQSDLSEIEMKRILSARIID